VLFVHLRMLRRMSCGLLKDTWQWSIRRAL
jgi:hypothetical protein